MNGREQVFERLVRTYEENGGWPVHVRELMRVCGERSTKIIHGHLADLVEVGLVERGPSQKDGFRPT